MSCRRVRASEVSACSTSKPPDMGSSGVTTSLRARVDSLLVIIATKPSVLTAMPCAYPRTKNTGGTRGIIRREETEPGGGKWGCTPAEQQLFGTRLGLRHRRARVTQYCVERGFYPPRHTQSKLAMVPRLSLVRIGLSVDHLWPLVLSLSRSSCI